MSYVIIMTVVSLIVMTLMFLFTDVAKEIDTILFTIILSICIGLVWPVSLVLLTALSFNFYQHYFKISLEENKV